MPKNSDTTQFIERAIQFHGLKYDYSKVIYINSRTKVEIVCPDHGSFLQTPADHLSGSGCKKCADDKQRSTIENFIKKAIVVHGNKYDYSAVEYKNSFETVLIICPIHGKFEQQPSNHLFGRGCLQCGLSVQRSTIENFIKKAIVVHGNKYDYSAVEYKNSSEKVLIICPIHGKFEQTPNHHLKGRGCPQCGTDKRRSNTADFINRAVSVHGLKYDYSKVIYINNHTKVEIVCPDHGKFEQIPTSHLSGKRCLQCGTDKRRSNIENFIKKAIVVHGNKYDYSAVEYKNSPEKVLIICPIHGKFEQQPTSHLRGKGCKKCGIDKRRSNIENIIKKAIVVHGNKYDYSAVEYKNSSEKVLIICPIHGKFEQPLSHHLKGRGCPQCGYTAVMQHIMKRHYGDYESIIEQEEKRIN